MEGTIVCVVKNTPSGGHPSGRGELDTAKKNGFTMMSPRFVILTIGRISFLL
jgi:hypothetical protein